MGKEQTITKVMKDRLKQINAYGLGRTSASVYATAYFIKRNIVAAGTTRPNYALLLRMENLGLFEWRTLLEGKPTQEAVLTDSGRAVISQ